MTDEIIGVILGVVRLGWDLAMNSVPIWGGYVLFVKRPAGPLFFIALSASIQWVILHWE